MLDSSCLEITIKAQALLKYSVILAESENSLSEPFDLNLKSNRMSFLLEKLNDCFDQKGAEKHLLDLDLQKELGSLLFKNVVKGKIYEIYSEKRDSEVLPLRIRLNIETEALQNLPWELMYDSDRDSWLSRDPELTFSRFSYVSKSSKKVALPVPISVLLALANPLGLDEHELDLDREGDKIKLALQNLIDSGEINLTLMNENVTLQEIHSQLLKNVNILHISGHGGLVDNTLNILLENDDGRKKLVPFERFIAMVSGIDSLKAVILDACELASGANSLLKRKIPIAIAMRSSILDESATIFFGNFYESIVNGFPIDKSVTIARMNLVAKFGEERVDWFTPILYLASPESALIDLLKTSPKSIVASKRSDNLIALRSIGRFVGRRAKIRELKDKLFNNDSRVIIVEGLSGDGKTALVSKVLMEEKDRFTAIFSHRVTNETSMELLLSEFNDFLVKNEDYSLETVWNQPNLNIQNKLEKMVEVLIHNRYLIFLDGFQNLISNKKIKDENIDRFLELLLSRKIASKAILTTWERFEIAQGGFLGSQETVHLPPLETDEGRRLLSKLGMGEQSTVIKNQILGITGGSPKFIELFVGLAKKFTINDLLQDHSLFTRQAYGKIGKRFIERLDADERNALQNCVLFMRPVSMNLLQCVGLQPEMIGRLTDLFILDVNQEEGNYWVHDSLSYSFREYFSENSNDMYKKMQNKLGECLEKNAQKSKDIWNLLEARFHFLEAKNYSKSMDIVQMATDPLVTWGYLDFALRINDESLKIATGKNKAIFLRYISAILEHKGEYNEALEKLNQSEKIFQELQDKLGLSSTIYLRGVIYHDTGELDKALNCFYQSLGIAKEISNKGGILTNLQHIAIILQDRGEYELSLENLNQCLSIAEEIGEERAVAACLHHIGITHQHRGEYDEAIRIFNNSMKIQRKFGDISGISGNLHHIGVIHQHKGEYNEALKIFKQILKISQDIGDPRAIAAINHEIGIIFQEKGKYDKAIEKFNKALIISTEIGDSIGIASSLYHIGIAHQHIGEFDKALKIYNETLKTFENVGDQRSISAVLHNMGLIHESKGELDEALEIFNQALKIKNKLGDQLGVAITLSQIGVVYEHKGEYDEALKIYNETLKTFTALGDQVGISSSLHQIGTIYQLNGNYDEALRNFNEALKIRVKLGDQKGIAATLMHIGMFYQNSGKFEKAMEKFNEALRIAEKIDDPIGISGILHSIGVILQSKGEFDQALEKFNQALKIAEKTSLQRGVSASLHHIGMILQDKGDYTGALEKFNQAMIISKKSGDQKGLGANIHHIGLIYLDKGDYNRAIEEFNKSLLISKKMADQHGVATTLQQIGVALKNKGEFEEALKIFSQSTKIFESLEDQQGIAINNYFVGILYQDRDDLNQALIYFEQSLVAFRKMGNLAGIASTFSLLSKIHLEKRNFKKAIIYCRMGMALFEMTGSPETKSTKLDLEKIRYIIGDQEFERINKEIDKDIPPM